MGDRVTVKKFVENVYLFNQESDSTGGEAITKEGIKKFVQQYVNEVIPNNEKENQTQDVTTVYRQHPGWTLQNINEEANETIGLEEQFRYYQEYCQSPSGKKIVETSKPEQAVVCKYFDDNWKDRFPATTSKSKSDVRIPIKLVKTQEGYEDDGDSMLVIMNSETHDVRFAETDTQESLKNNDFVVKMRKEDYKKYPPSGTVESDYCYWSKTKQENLCVAKLVATNSKVRRQTFEVWDGVVGMAKSEGGVLASAFKDRKQSAAIKEAFETVGDMATEYRGKIATIIRKDIVAFGEKAGVEWGLEPSYAISQRDKGDTKEESQKKKKEGRLNGVDKYGRILGWIVVSDADLFRKYLLDEEYGLSPLAQGKLHDFYLEKKAAIEAELDKIDFKKLGLDEESGKKLRMIFLDAVPDPVTMYPKDKMAQMAEEWKNVSTAIEGYNYPDNFNFFEIFPLGLANHLDKFYPEKRGGTARHLFNETAKKGWGLFESKIFMLAYAPRIYYSNPEK